MRIIGKIRITKANTAFAQFVYPIFIPYKSMLDVCDYIDELRQSADWGIKLGVSNG